MTGFDPSPLPNGLGGAFLVTEALALGATRRRLRASDLERPFHGVRTLAATTTAAEVVRAYAPLLPPHHAFARATAALLLDMRVPRRLVSDLPHVVALGGRAPESRGVVGHRSDREPNIVLVDGVPVTDPVSTWLDLAPTASIRELVQMGDALVRRTDPLADLSQLHAGVRSRIGARGVRKLRAAAALIRPRTDSSAETTLRLNLTSIGLPEPTVNAPLVDEYGRVFALGDLVHEDARVVWEYDGSQHFDDLRQRTIDLERWNRISRHYRLIRVHAGVLHDLPLLRRLTAGTRLASGGEWSPFAG